ncbi:MAG: carboxypeptidase-like regulatory domain-containing protein [Bacteroidota bacterium]
MLVFPRQRRYFLLPFLLLFAVQLSAQIRVQAQVLDAESQEPLAYATVARLDNSGGTLTNTDGIFFLLVNHLQDSLAISFIGYQAQRIELAQLMADSTVLLIPQRIELTDITVTADDDYLYRAIANCRKSLRNAPRETARTYFQLVTRSPEQPLEMIQAYYNTDLSLQGIEQFRLKNGRAALATQDGMYFINMGTTQAITRMELFELSDVFNTHPLQLGLGALRRKYKLSRLASLANTELFHLSFEPRSAEDPLFSGEIWIDKSDFSLHRLILRDERVERHPFYSVFSHSRISRLGLEISFNFERQSEAMRLSHVSWNFDMRMAQVDPTPYKPLSEIVGEGVLYFYDYSGEFQEPYFEHSPYHHDYRKISFIPYNAEFWSRNHGLLYTEEQQRQMDYFAEHGFLLNHPQANERADNSFTYNNPLWQADQRVSYLSEQQIKADPVLHTQVPPPPVNKLLGVWHQVEARIYLDLNHFDGEQQYSSAVLLDYLYTRTNPPIDSFENCLLNIYFDLCEIERRAMMTAITEAVGDAHTINRIYQEANQKIESVKSEFYTAMRSPNQSRLLIGYNNYIQDRLGIDNLKIFKIEL